MPLKCLCGDDEVFAFDYEAASKWKALREANAKEGNLQMPCCGSAVVLRTSPLGTRHFAHARRGPCETAPEAVEHLLAKRKIVEGIRRTGWTAKTEQEGMTPEGERWRADVMATKGKNRVAIEVQWSRQHGEETLRRQHRYDDAGVRGLWLFRQHDFPVAQDVPAFRLDFDDRLKVFFVLLPSPLFHPKWIKSRDKDEPRYWGQRIPLEDFVEGAVSGRLKFSPVIDRTVPMDVLVTPALCRRCKTKTRLVTGIVFAASRALPGHPDIPTSLFSLGELIGGPERVAALLPPSLLKRHGIGALRVRQSGLDVEGRQAYLSNACVNCDAMQARWFEDRLQQDEELALSVDVVFDALLACQLPHIDHIVSRWWFDVRPTI
jgi:hypothetical protein